jgi:hypothetical protein
MDFVYVIGDRWSRDHVLDAHSCDRWLIQILSRSRYSTPASNVWSLLPGISLSGSRTSHMPRTTQKARKSTGGPASQVSLAALRTGETNIKSGQTSPAKEGEVSSTKIVPGVRVSALGTCQGIAAAYWKFLTVVHYLLRRRDTGDMPRMWTRGLWCMHWVSKRITHRSSKIYLPWLLVEAAEGEKGTKTL